jgi:hypothetical protein
MGGKNVFEIEIVLLDVSHKGVDGASNVNKGRFFGLGIVQEIAVRLDRSGHLMKDDELA